MTYDWILDVLGDLKEFATHNGLTALAQQLDQTSLVATAEIKRVIETSAAVTATGSSSAAAVVIGVSAYENT
jgi:hypothetical protein